ncbi:MAG TPA: xanthine dehydrogenase family protein molybdopterin-binding subunit [Candidatus Limnocylindrales bacterium]
MTATIAPTLIRQDGRDKVTGSGRYAADLTVTGMLHGALRTADVPHARIRRIDTTAARALSGVHAVITAADVPEVRYGAYLKDRTLFARDVVRWEGDLIAAVAAVTPEIAARAAALIEIDLEPLPALTDLEAAARPDASLVHDAWATYETDENLVREGNVASRSTIVKGDAEAAMGTADVVVTGRYVADGSHAVPIEPRAILAEWQGGHVTIWSSTQVPFAVRSGVADTLGLPQNQVRVIVPHLGGGFGAKCELGFEPQVAALAQAAGRPVKVVFSRRQEFLLPDHRRERMIIELTTGVRTDGTIVARQGRLIIDNGAYSMDEPYLGQLSAMFAVGPYRIPNVDVSADVVYTNTQPSGSVRAPTGPTTCWAVEQHHDVVAERLGLDPVEFRRRNLVHEGDEGPTGQIFERIGVIETLEHAAAAIDWDRPLEEGEAVGIATGWWPSFPGASGAHLTINADGSGTIVTGAQECGTGSVMALPILAAEVLGMRPDEFRILYQDTDAGPYDGGASGSQTTFNNGRAVIAAANEIREQLLDLAADFLEANRADLELVDGVVRVKGSQTSSVTIADLASQAAGAGLLLGRGSGEPPPTPAVNAASCVGRLGGESFAAPTFFTHAARVKVDRDTGVVRVLEVAASHESGTVINPIGAAGQIHGGVAMGIGQALSEGVLLTEDGRQRNPYLLDYKLQTAADVPPITVDFVDAPSPTGGPKGLKGIAEPPCVPTPGAIANAIARAIGTRVDELPMTPERVFGAIASVRED